MVVYAPTEDYPASDKDEFYSALETLVLSIPPHDKVIVLGDFNAETGNDRTCYEDVIGHFGAGATNDNSFRLLTMCSSLNLAALGSWFQRRTYTVTHGSLTMIERGKS